MTSHAKPSAKQKVSGVILIDKPTGMTSQQVVSKVKYLFKSSMHDSKKAGHTGTLDPMATGLLPICLGEATKFSHYQLDADKTYQAIISLGAQTDTGDADGQVIDTALVPAFDAVTLDQVATQFMGAQKQIPPMYSALKKEGKKLYEYARAGIEIEREPRDITIKAINLVAIDEQKIQLTVTCSKGTYVRVLGEDIAQALGTLGHLTALRRLKVGSFDLEAAITPDELEQLPFAARFESLLPIDTCVDIDTTLMLDSEQVARIHMGQRLNVIDQLDSNLQAYITNKAEMVANSSPDNFVLHEVPVDIRLVDEADQFLGLGAVSLNGRLQPKKLIQR